MQITHYLLTEVPNKSKSIWNEYGLDINWAKVDTFGIRCETKVKTMVGEWIQQKSSIQYLGALISVDGTIQSEVNRRIGMASADFKLLDILWTHSNVCHKEKYQIYLACIVS